MIQATTTLKKICALKKRIRAIQGGQGASKTFSILLMIMHHMRTQSNQEIFIASAELTKMRNTIIKDWVKIIRLLGLEHEITGTAGTLFTHKNGSFVKFLGLDVVDIGKGLRGDILYINEANKIGLETATQLIGREFRVVFLDWNPDSKFWFHHEYEKDPSTDFIIVTYLDNEALPDNERKEIEAYYTRGYNADGTIKNKYWANKHRVYALGEVGQVDGAIFENWELYREYPDEEYTRLFGIDWGSVDPTVLVEVRFYPEKKIYTKLHYYKPVKDLTDLKNVIRRVTNERDLLIADGAGRDKILELAQDGFSIIKSDKSALTSYGSIVDGIDILQQYSLFVHENDKELIEEFTNYAWKKDKYSGQQIPVPIDEYNHGIDSLRYACRAFHLYGY